MQIIRRYLLLDMLKPTFVALFIVLAIIWLMRSLRFIDYIVNRGLDAGDFLLMSSLLLPSLLIFVLPISFFIGVCFAFKRLADDSEMDALLAAGMSRLKIILPAVIAAIIISIIGLANAFWLMPYSKNTFKDIQVKVRDNQGALLLEESSFNPVSKDLTIYMDERSEGGNLKNLLIYDTRNAQKPVTWIAKSGQINNQTGRVTLSLQDAARLEVTDRQLYTLAFDDSSLTVTQQSNDSSNRWRKPDEQYMGELLFSSDSSQNPYQKEFTAEFARRIIWPLTPIPMVFFAAIFMVRGRKSRFSRGHNMALAGGVAVIYMVALAALHNIASNGSIAAVYISALLPIIAIAILISLLSDHARMPSRRTLKGSRA